MQGVWVASLDQIANRTGHNPTDGSHVGSKALYQFIRDNPIRLHLFGHIHGSFGILGKSINGAYPIRQKFIGIELESGKIEIVAGRLKG
jgi:Icc-related predicted phosphoesterase